MKEIVILGAGDFGKEVAWLIEEINKRTPTYIILGYLDDDEKKIGQSFNGYECLGPISYLTDLNKNHHACAVIANQDVDIRKKFVDMFPDFNDWETLIHPSVNISDTSTVGQGCVIGASGNVSCNTTIGDFCLFNISVTMGHDCVVGNYVSIMSGSCVSGHVTIGDGAYLATNCTIVPGMKVGEHAKVGAGSVVIRNVRADTTVMGVPAKKIVF